MDKVEFLVQRYDYGQLSPQEQLLVQESLGSAEAYRLMRISVLQAKASNTEIKAPAAMKQELMGEFQKKHRSADVFAASGFAGLLFHKKVPAYVLLLLLIVAIGPYFFLIGPENRPTTVTLVEVPSVPDTVFVTMAADTVFQERVVYQKVYVEAPPTPSLTTQEQNVFTSSDVSTSLADNVALTDLTVSID
ncbi:MAG: hypothetical protein AAFO69_08545 [Bacteroidota bacterium]